MIKNTWWITWLVSLKHNVPWYNDEICAEKRWRRAFECKWSKSKGEQDLIRFKKQKCVPNKLIVKTKKRLLQ